jgi:RimJ/RimL family protein N-acetyltransferase
MQLATPRLLLKEISAADLNDIHALHSIPEVDEYNTLGLPESIDETRTLLNEWLQKQQSTPRMAYTYTMRIAESGDFIGLIALNILRPKFRNAEVWYKILPSAWGKGFTTEALNRLLNYAFCDLGLHRIEAGCAVGNIGSIKVLEKVGFTREGSKRKVLPIRGKWIDNYFYAILDTDKDWQKLDNKA